MTRLSQKDVRVSVYSSNNGTLRIGLRSLFYYLPPVLSAKDIKKTGMEYNISTKLCCRTFSRHQAESRFACLLTSILVCEVQLLNDRTKMTAFMNKHSFEPFAHLVVTCTAGQPMRRY